MGERFITNAKPAPSVGESQPRAQVWRATLMDKLYRNKQLLMIGNRLLSLVPFLLLASISSSCRTQLQSRVEKVDSQNAASPSPTPMLVSNDEPNQSVVDCINEVDFLEPGEKAGALKAWKQVPNNNNYRMVKASDFRIPGWVKSEYYWQDVERSTGWSHEYGELGGAYGLVLFMINKNVTDANRFSVAVLIKRPGNRYDLYWIFQNADLSRVNLRRHSGDAYLQEFLENNGSRVCDIQWSRKLKRWACDFDQP